MIEAFAAYLRERFRLKVFGTAAAVHAAAALWVAGGSPVLASSVVAYLDRYGRKVGTATAAR